MAETRIVVVGAGVSGLTSALLLSKHPRYKITVVAKHMPGDYDIEYASPWAGANYEPVSKANTIDAERDKNTWPELKRLAAEHPESGVHFQEARNFANPSDSGPIASAWSEPLKADAWFKDVVPNFRPLKPTELRAHASGTSFTSVCINTSLYLPYLVSQCLSAGVIFRRAILTHISDASSLFSSSPTNVPVLTPSGTAIDPITTPPSSSSAAAAAEEAKADIIINATGLSSLKLGGVQDSSLYPARGQTVIVRNTSPFMACTSGTSDGDEERCYAMTRAAGGGTVLGGSFQPGNWSAEVDGELAGRIMARAVELVPELVGGTWTEGKEGKEGKGKGDVGGLSVIRHGVGLRPCRRGGVRIEREFIGGEGEGDGDGKGEGRGKGEGDGKEGKEGGVWVVHNYGHGGYGYQSSYGCAMEVVRLVGECVEVAKGAVIGG